MTIYGLIEICNILIHSRKLSYIFIEIVFTTQWKLHFNVYIYDDGILDDINLRNFQKQLNWGKHRFIKKVAKKLLLNKNVSLGASFDKVASKIDRLSIFQRIWRNASMGPWIYLRLALVRSARKIMKQQRSGLSWSFRWIDPEPPWKAC